MRGKDEGKEVPWTRGVRGSDDGEGVTETPEPRASGGQSVGWSIPSRSVQGRITERKILKARGAKVHSNSGAGRVKDDGHDEEAIYEIKDAQKSHTIIAKEIRGLRKRAAQQGKQGVYIIKFPGFTLECFIRQGWSD